MELKRHGQEQLLILTGILAALLSRELKTDDLEVIGNLLQALGSLLTTAAADRERNDCRA